MPEEPVQVIEHTADWSIRVRAPDLARLFEHAALGMAALLVEDPQAMPCTTVRSLTLDAYDVETLLVDWLSELAYWAESEQLIPCALEMAEISSSMLRADVSLAQAAALDKHIKAVTYHNLNVQQTADGLEVTIVFDV